MKKSLILLSLLVPFFFLSCQTNIDNSEISYLNNVEDIESTNFGNFKRISGNNGIIGEWEALSVVYETYTFKADGKYIRIKQNGSHSTKKEEGNYWLNVKDGEYWIKLYYQTKTNSYSEWFKYKVGKNRLELKSEERD